MDSQWHALTYKQQLNILIRPRADWLDIERIAGILPQIIDAMVVRSKAPLESEGLKNFCRQICEGAVPRTELSGNHHLAGVNGLKGHYPQHAALRDLALRNTVDPWLIECSAVLILCSHEWQNKAMTADGLTKTALTDVFNTKSVNAWRGLRLLSAEVVSELEPVPGTPYEVKLAVKSYRLKADSRTLNEFDSRYLQFIIAFFDHFFGQGISRSSPAREQAVKPVRHLIPEVTDSHSDMAVASVRWFHSHSGNQHIRTTDAYLHGNAPEEELESGPILQQLSGSIKTQTGESSRGHVMRARSAGDHRRRQAQLLPSRWDELNDSEVARVLRFIHHNSATNSQKACLLLLMLITGRSQEEVLQARVVRNINQVPRSPKSKAIYLVHDNHTWVTGVLSPEQRRKRKGHWENLLEITHEFLELPIPAIFWRDLRYGIGSVANTVKRRSVALFGRASSTRKLQDLTPVIKALNKSHRGRVTAHRIEHQLFNEVYQESTDIIDACLITGKLPPFGQSAALYYHHCDMTHLADVYLRVLTRWANFMCSSVEDCHGRATLQATGRVGSNLTLKPSVVRKVMESLRQQLNADRRQLGVTWGLQRFHNAFTSYCLMMIFFATGYRVVADPVARETDIDLDAAVMVIADKTDDSMGHSRQIPLCRVLVEQLGYYQRHVEWLKQQLRFTVGFVHDDLSLPHFFYLENWQLKRIFPGEMARQLEWAYPLPLNLGRHLLRGELRARGISGAMVDRFMGHWGIGQEPWGKFSGTDPLSYHAALKPVLNSLMNELGFVAERGAV